MSVYRTIGHTLVVFPMVRFKVFHFFIGRLVILFAGPKEEQCPPVPAGTLGLCAEMCPETGCGAGKKCCSDGCGHVCKDVANTGKCCQISHLGI